MELVVESYTGANVCPSLLSNSITTSLINGSVLFGPLPPTITATFTPQPAGSVTIVQAANTCGYTNFDWQQTIYSNPIQDTVTAVKSSPECPAPQNKCVTPPPFLDPPLGGYKYEETLRDKSGNLIYPNGDNAFPFYWDADPNSGELLKEEPDGFVLNFEDTPSDPCLLSSLGLPSVAYLTTSAIRDACGNSTAPKGSYVGFTTHLVGICGTAAGCKSSFVPGTETNCITLQTCVDLKIGFNWISTFNGRRAVLVLPRTTCPPTLAAELAA
jgi:hypothetical protein